MYGQPNYYGNQFYGQPMQFRPQPIQQPVQPQMPQMDFNKPNGIQGKIVDSMEAAKAMDINLDGSISYFPLTDNSSIITKQLMQDGTSKITVYKPVTQTKPAEEIKYVTEKDLNNAISKINTSDWKEEIKTVKKQIKELTLDLDEIKERKD